jgi:hypothetical protein
MMLRAAALLSSLIVPIAGFVELIEVSGLTGRGQP